MLRGGACPVYPTIGRESSLRCNDTLHSTLLFLPACASPLLDVRALDASGAIVAIWWWWCS